MNQKAFARTRKSFPIAVIPEAGLDGFWLHRALEQEGVESHVVDPASIATSRRRRRAKTDRIDGEAAKIIIRLALGQKDLDAARLRDRAIIAVRKEKRDASPTPVLTCVNGGVAVQYENELNYRGFQARSIIIEANTNFKVREKTKVWAQAM